MRGAIPKKEENFTGKSIHEYIFVIWKKAVMICSKCQGGLRVLSGFKHKKKIYLEF